MTLIDHRFSVTPAAANKLRVDLQFGTKEGETVTISVLVPNANWTVTDLQLQALSRLSSLAQLAQRTLETGTKAPTPAPSSRPPSA
jgi:hypothetical protein